jgi:predicted nucleotide-binding protein
MLNTVNRKPRVFIGCSREAIKYARAVMAQLEYQAEVSPWFAGTFGANHYTMEALEKELDSNDFGVFILATDDVAKIRDKTVFITRDNTIFEIGLFWGRLRRRRVFAIIPRDVQAHEDLVNGEIVSEFHILSDLSGLTLLQYGKRDDDNYQAAVSTACGKILEAIETEKLFEDPNEILHRKQSVLRFFWEYLRNVSMAEPAERYQGFTEAIRNSLITPLEYRTIGAAIWKADGEHIAQVGGNVGRGRSFSLNQNGGNDKDRKITVVDVYNTREWSFYKVQDVAHVYVLCYPLGKDHVLSVHITGLKTLDEPQLENIVGVNDELLRTITLLVKED